MATMNYETPDVTKIHFKNSLFATTSLNRRQNEKVKKIVESEGGGFKESVTKSTNYLIYDDGKEETIKYKKALEWVQDKGLEIKVISWSTFRKLTTMSYITPNVTKIDFEDSLFVLTDVGRENTKDVRALIESRGGIIKGSVTKATNYLIYGDGKDETTNYKNALELINDKGLEINVLPLSLFLTIGRGQVLVEFGNYPFEPDGTKRPIQWAVLKRNNKKALLLSAYGLDAKPYNEEQKDITWEKCTLRKWLNEEFFDSAFDAEEQQRIITTKLINADNPGGFITCTPTPGGRDTDDKVFLLSCGEVEEYLSTDIERRVAPTPYAVKNGAIKWDKSYLKDGGIKAWCWWWLRSPGYYPDDAACVVDDGYIYDGGGSVNDGRFAVCPAMWVELE